MNIPNALSLVRLAMVPVFAVVYFTGGDYANIYAALIYAAASLTDVLDGKIARKYNMTTKLGRILDPLGDKLMTFVVLICITIKCVIPVWAVIVFFCKELLMAVGGWLLYRVLREMPPSNYFGKASTVVFFTVCVLLMLVPGIPATAATIMISVALAVMIAALVSYALGFVKIVRHYREKKNAD